MLINIDQRQTYICNDCFILGQYKIFHGLTKLIYKSIFREQSQIHHMEKSVMVIIARYALFFQCRNHGTMTNFDASFERGIIPSRDGGHLVNVSDLKANVDLLWGRYDKFDVPCRCVHVKEEEEEEEESSRDGYQGFAGDSSSSEDSSSD